MNIRIPEQEVEGEGLIRRSQMQTRTAAAPNDYASSSKSASGSSENASTAKGKHRNTTLAGTEALQVLRRQIAPYLLSRLPDLSTPKFSEHGKPIRSARLRLLIGTYGKRSILKWTKEVYAYFEFRKHPQLDPKMYMKVAQPFEGG
jgi:hypothetical protein